MDDTIVGGLDSLRQWFEVFENKSEMTVEEARNAFKQWYDVDNKLRSFFIQLNKGIIQISKPTVE
jgi:hypothetical protein